LTAPTPDVTKRILWEEIAPLEIECKRFAHESAHP